ncbi:MAG: LOG family protein [Phycisphaerales bacterium]|nr:LOG family protein [Phycisphaerales bacterium]
MDTSNSDRPIVCIFGSYSPKPGEPLFELAYAIGQALAKAGFTVCNGGYDGTMLASAQGAKEAGRATIGVTCSIFGGYRGQTLKANHFIDREIHHDNVLARIDAMIRMSRGYVVLEGGTGTLSEFGLLWEYVAKGLVEPGPSSLSVISGNRWLSGSFPSAPGTAGTFTALIPRNRSP